MSLPIWASQVWAQKPDIQQMIDSQKADQARQAQLALSSVGLMMEQQKLAADQRNFQQSMALKMQEDASKQAAQAWEMQLAEKKMAQQTLQDQLENKRIEAQIANYNRMNQPVAATPMPSYPSFDSSGQPVAAPEAAMPEQVTQTTTTTDVGPLIPQAAPPGPSLETGQPQTAESLLAASQGTSPTMTLQGFSNTAPVEELLTRGQSQPVALNQSAPLVSEPFLSGLPQQGTQYAPMPVAPDQPPQNEAAAGFNTLTGAAPQQALARTLTQTSAAPSDDYSGMKVGERRTLSPGKVVEKLPNGQVQFGVWQPATKTKAADFKWSSPEPAVKKTASKVDTSAEKEKAAQAAVAAEIKNIGERYPDLGARAQKVLSTPGLSETTVRSLASDLKQEAADRVKVETTTKTKEEKAVATAQKAIAEAEKTDKADLWKVRNSIGDDLKAAQKQQAKLAESKSSDPELDSRVEELKARYGAYNQKITEHISDQAKSAEDAAVAKYNPTQQEKIDAFTAAKGRPPATGKPTDPAVIKDWGEAYYLAKDAYAKSKGLSTAAAPSASAVSPVASSASGVPFWQKWSSQK